MLCLNVTAGIGILEQASPMIQEMFPGAVLRGGSGGVRRAASLANMGGRFFWFVLSDRIGRRATYAIFFCSAPCSMRPSRTFGAHGQRATVRARAAR